MTLPIFLFSSSEQMNKEAWFIVDDGVMGGRSQGNMLFNKNGQVEFSGTVSLANNGGFSSLRYEPSITKIKKAKAFHIYIKGDGKRYQFRSKSTNNQRHAYKKEFSTSGEWEEIIIPFEEMEATFRGRMLDLPNYPGESIEEIAFLIGNKKEESFNLVIDKIEVR